MRESSNPAASVFPSEAISIVFTLLFECNYCSLITVHMYCGACKSKYLEACLCLKGRRCVHYEGFQFLFQRLIVYSYIISKCYYSNLGRSGILSLGEDSLTFDRLLTIEDSSVVPFDNDVNKINITFCFIDFSSSDRSQGSVDKGPRNSLAVSASSSPSSSETELVTNY